MYERIFNEFIRIPNVICNDLQISPTSKYLYGWILNQIYYGDFYKTIEDISIILRCSVPTARKVIKELQSKEYIKVEIIDGNRRKITPLINDSMVLIEKARSMEERDKVNREIVGLIKKETPEVVKQFIKDIK